MAADVTYEAAIEMHAPSKALQAKLQDALALCGVTLPLRLDEENAGVLLDATGAEVLVVDVDRQREDADVVGISCLVLLAVNACAGCMPDGSKVQAGVSPACPPNSDAPAVAPAGVSDPAAQSESFARGTTETGTGD